MRGNAGILRRFGRRADAALACLAVFAAAGAVAGGAEAHQVRFVASYGSDASPCTRAAPCRKLQRGINVTPEGGELIVLDPGDLGDAVTIGRSIAISAIGVSATLGGGISIDAAGATVVMRGLRLNGAAAAGSGIRVVNAAAVHVVDCEVRNFSGGGIAVNNAVATKLFVSGAVVSNNGFDGLFFSTGAGGALAVDEFRFENNGVNSGYSGVKISGGEARISRTIVSANFGDGIRQSGGSVNLAWTTTAHNGGDGYRLQGGGSLTLEQSVLRGNVTGLRVLQAGSVAVLSNSVVTDNSTGLSVQAAVGARLWTRGTSTVSGNATDVSGGLIDFEGK